MEEIISDLDDMIEGALHSEEEANRLGHNSYGAGMCYGERLALQRIRHRLVNGEWPEF